VADSSDKRPKPTPASDRLIREMYRDDPVEGEYVFPNGKVLSSREFAALSPEEYDRLARGEA
jgi:hypothetical protein